MSALVGYDGSRKIKGHKCFTLVDTFDLLLAVDVAAANVPEHESTKQVLNKIETERQRFPRLMRTYINKGFGGDAFVQ